MDVDLWVQAALWEINEVKSPSNARGLSVPCYMGNGTGSRRQLHFFLTLLPRDNPNLPVTDGRKLPFCRGSIALHTPECPETSIGA